MFLFGILVSIPKLFNLSLKGSESYPLSARIIPGLPTELFVIVGIARGMSWVLPEAKTTLKGVPSKSTKVDILVPVSLCLPEYPVVSRKLKLGTSEPSIDDMFRFNLSKTCSFWSIASQVNLSPSLFPQNRSLLQCVTPVGESFLSRSLHLEPDLSTFNIPGRSSRFV